MELTVKFINYSFLALAAVTLIWNCYSMGKIFKLRARFNAAIVLIPLYKRSEWLIAAIVLVSIAMLFDIVFMVFYSYYLFAASLMFICVNILILLITMVKTKCAVLDSGIVVPFRFIDWTHFYDYSVEDNTVFFCGEENGADTLNGATGKLRFDPANAEKLNYILSKHKSQK